MQIPDEVSRAAGGLRWEDALQCVAEWARKEALKEAAKTARRWSYPSAPVELAILALAEGED